MAKAEWTRQEVEAFERENERPDQEVCEHGVLVAKYVIPRFTEGELLHWKRVEQGECTKCIQQEREEQSESKEEARKEDCNSVLGIPPRFYKANPTSEYYELFKKKKGLVFSGEVGTGKTHEAISLIKHLYIKHDVQALFEPSADLIYELRNSISKGEFEQVITRYQTTNLLVIDDLGTETATEFLMENLYMIINYRYNYMKPIIMTTNLNASDFAKVYGQRLLSRLTEMATFVKLDGKDKRVK